MFIKLKDLATNTIFNNKIVYVVIKKVYELFKDLSIWNFNECGIKYRSNQFIIINEIIMITI